MTRRPPISTLFPNTPLSRSPAAANTPRVKSRARRRAVAPGAHQRIDHRDAVAGLEVRLRHMGANEARAPGHEDPHSTVTLFARLRGWSTSCPRSLAI